MAINTEHLTQMQEFSYVVELTRENILEWLHKLIDHALFNNKNVDIIDYERVIYTDITFKDDEEISALVKELKQAISSNYKKKKCLFQSTSGLQIKQRLG